MNSSPKWVLAFALTAALVVPGYAKDSAASQIKSEITRLQQSLKDYPVADKDAAQIATMADGAIKSAAAALDTGQMYVALEAPTAVAFGDITSVPTMFLFDPSGKTARVLYGAPPDLHESAENTLAQMMH